MANKDRDRGERESRASLALGGTKAQETTFVLDLAFSPIIVVRYPVYFSLSAYRRFLEEFVASVPDTQRIAIWTDLRSVDLASGNAKARKDGYALLCEHLEYFRKVVVCEGRFTSNPIIRAAVTVFDWAYPLPWPNRTFRSGVVAENWARLQLRKEGIDCRESLLR